MFLDHYRENWINWKLKKGFCRIISTHDHTQSRGMAGLYNGIDFKDLWKNTIRLMIKCEPGQLRQDSSMYNGVYTSHHVYSLHSSYSGPRKYCLGTSKGTSDWRLDHTGSAIITQDYPGDPCGHLPLRPRGHWSLAPHCHWAPWSHWGTWCLSFSPVSPWIFMFYPLGDAGTGAGVGGLDWCSHHTVKHTVWGPAPSAVQSSHRPMSPDQETLRHWAS